MAQPLTHDAATDRCCLHCGAPGAESRLCSTHCRAEAELEMRCNRARARYLRRRNAVLAKDNLKLRWLDDRNAELLEALLATVPRRRS